MKIISIKEILKDRYTIDMSCEGMSGEAKSKNRAANQKKKTEDINRNSISKELTKQFESHK